MRTCSSPACSCSPVAGAGAHNGGGACPPLGQQSIALHIASDRASSEYASWSALIVASFRVKRPDDVDRTGPALAKNPSTSTPQSSPRRSPTY